MCVCVCVCVCHCVCVYLRFLAGQCVSKPDSPSPVGVVLVCLASDCLIEPLFTPHKESGLFGNH